MADSDMIPSAALPLAIFVLIYSFINVLASSLVSYLQWTHSNRLGSQYRSNSIPALDTSLQAHWFCPSDLLSSGRDHGLCDPIDEPANPLYLRMEGDLRCRI